MFLSEKIIFLFLALSIFSNKIQAQECEESPDLLFDFQVVGPLEPGSQFFIECFVTDFTEVSTFQYTFSYDQNVIQFDQLDNTGSPLIGSVEGNFTTDILNSGNIPIIWTNLYAEGQTLSPNTAIFKIFFNVIGQPKDCTYFEINSTQIMYEIGFELNSGSVCTETEKINFQVSGDDLCIGCGYDVFFNTNLCQGNLDFFVCGGTEPYSYTIESSTQGVLFEGDINEGDTISYENLEEGEYILEVLNAQGVSSIIYINNEFFEAPIIFSDSLCTGESAYLSTFDFYSSYKWFGPEGNIIAPEDVDEPWMINITEGGTYTLTTNHKGCTQYTEYFWEQDEIILSPVVGFSICNSSSNGNSTIVDLSELILNAPGPFLIFKDGFLLSDILYDFEGETPGICEFSIILLELGPCPARTFELEIEVIDCGCPELTISPIGSFCNSDQIYLNLNNYLSPGTSQSGNFTILFEGEIANIQPNTIGELIIDNNLESGSYQLAYTLDTLIQGCANTVLSTFFIAESPSPIISNPGSVCNSDTTGEGTTIDLNNLITDAAGNWQDETGATLNSGIQDFNGQVPGFYNYTFTTIDAIAPCNNVSLNLEIEVIDCTISSSTEIDNPILNVFPNPTYGSFNIELSEKMEVQIFDVSGKMIIKNNLKVGLNFLQLEKEKNGIYFIEFYNDKKFHGVHKLIIY